jgi:hypothetical protein
MKRQAPIQWEWGGRKRWLAVGLPCLVCVALLGQLPKDGIVRGAFRFPEYNKKNPARLDALVTGKGARTLPAGQVQLTEFRRESYTDEGRTNLIIVATNCVFDPASRSARSSDGLRVQSGDGQLSIEGIGFIWRQTNLTLTISNSVRTVLKTASPRPTTEHP